jgi:hypothetical protein
MQDGIVDDILTALNALQIIEAKMMNTHVGLPANCEGHTAKRDV